MQMDISLQSCQTHCLQDEKLLISSSKCVPYFIIYKFSIFFNTYPDALQSLTQLPRQVVMRNV